MMRSRLPFFRAFSLAAPLLISVMLGGVGAGIGVAHAQDPKSEIHVPPPARFAMDGLIPITISGPSEVAVGIDPAHLSIGTDNIVRYVLVARSASGAQTVTFEGIDCKSASTRVLARWNANTQEWRVLDSSEWKSLYDDRGSRYAKAMARGGVCDGPTPTMPLSGMIRALKTGRTSYND